MGGILASGSADETLRLWNLSALLTSEDSCETDINQGESHHATSPNGSVTDISRKKVSVVLKSYGGCIKCCSFSANGAFLASGSADNLVRVWRVRGRVLLHSLKGHKNWVLSLAFSPVQEASFATASADGTVRLWDLDNAAPQASCTVLKAKSQTGGMTLGSSKDVTCCSYNALGTLLCTGGADKLVRIWSLPGGTCQRVLHGHRGQVNCVAFQGGTGRLVASVEGNASFHHFSSDNALILWDLEAEAGRELLVRLTGHKRRVNSCSFNGSGALIATGANDNTVRLWMLSPGLQEWGPGEEGRTRSDPCREDAAIDDGSVQLYFGGRDSGSEAGSTTASVSASASARGRSRAEGDDDCEIEEEGDLMGGGVFGALTAYGGDGLRATDDVPAKASSASSSRTVSSSLPYDKERSAQTPQDAPSLHVQHTPAKRNDSVQSRIGGDNEAGNEDEDNNSEGGQVGVESAKRAEWVQVRAPFRVEARILDLTPPNAPMHIDRIGASNAVSQATTTTTAEVLGDDGMPLFSVMADFGRVEIGSHDVSLNPPSEPPSTGIEMKLLNGPDQKHPRTFRGSLAR